MQMFLDVSIGEVVFNNVHHLKIIDIQFWLKY